MRLAIEQRRCARLAAVEATLTAAEWTRIVEAWDHRCAYCGCAGELQIEHVLALSKGGAFSRENVVPACARCNASKGTRDVSAWLLSRGEDPATFMTKRSGILSAL